MNTDQPSRDQKPGDSLRLSAFVVRPGPIHHEDTKTRRITKSFRNAESCLSCSGRAAADERVQPAATLCALRVFAVKPGSVSPREHAKGIANAMRTILIVCCA